MTGRRRNAGAAADVGAVVETRRRQELAYQLRLAGLRSRRSPTTATRAE